jgi:hypothetical protein
MISHDKFMTNLASIVEEKARCVFCAFSDFKNALVDWLSRFRASEGNTRRKRQNRVGIVLNKAQRERSSVDSREHSDERPHGEHAEHFQKMRGATNVDFADSMDLTFACI